MEDKMEYAIRLEGLAKSFQKEKVLKGITHDFEKGKIHGIMGFNGSGKTVMFKCICEFEKTGVSEAPYFR